jgi:hypothetical protein
MVEQAQAGKAGIQRLADPHLRRLRALRAGLRCAHAGRMTVPGVHPART